MTDTQKLEELIKNSGLKIGFIVDKLGISRQSFNNKRQNITEFTPTEITVLCHLFSITNDLVRKNEIFFALDVEYNSTN